MWPERIAELEARMPAMVALYEKTLRNGRTSRHRRSGARRARDERQRFLLSCRRDQVSRAAADGRRHLNTSRK
jgi:hypothetical protein